MGQSEITQEFWLLKIDLIQKKPTETEKVHLKKSKTSAKRLNTILASSGNAVSRNANNPPDDQTAL